MEFDRTEEFASMMEHEVDGVKMFGKKVYDDAFNELFNRYTDVMQAYVNGCAELDDESCRAMAHQVGAAFISREEERLARETRMSRRRRLDDDNLYMALFVIPAIGYFKAGPTDILAKTLVELWRAQYPEHPINQGDYEKISNGFKKHRFCYITTAVCESLGKDDSCEELMCLREFRDHWLLLTDGGQELVDRYYETAPGVIRAMQQRPDYRELCRDIYERYICPCIHMIHEGRYEDCKVHYIDMVETLKAQYVTGDSSGI